MILARVTGPNFVAGLLLDERGCCVRAAPILRWTIGLYRDALRVEFRRLGWHAAVIGSATEAHPLLCR